MKKIPLTQDKFALVSDEDFDFLNQWKWYAFQPKNNKTMYAFRTKGHGKGIKKSFAMHFVLMKPAKGLVTDHINGDGLDNRRENLRICTTAENMRNRTRLNKNNKSGFKGVSWQEDHSAWRATVMFNRKQYFGGFYDTVKEAAKGYNQLAKKLFGEFAALNKL